MLIIVMVLMIVSTIVVVYTRRDILSVFLMALMASFVLMFSGAIIYIAKVGGYSKLQRMFLFLLPNLQTKLQYLPIPLGRLGYLVAIGRSLFPYFLLIIAFEYTMIAWVRRHYKILRILTLFFPILFLIYYYPPIFRIVVDGRFWLLLTMRKIALAWIIAYIVMAISLLVIEYINITIPFYRQRFSYIMFSQISIALLYGMYAVQDPGQIYNMYISEYISIGSLSYIKTSFNNYGWVLLALLTMFLVILGAGSLIHYTHIEHQEDKADIKIQRKFDATSMGTTVFIHSIKNQLLASRVLHKRIEREFSKEKPSMDALQGQVNRLKNINEGMISRMDELYDTVKESALTLKPHLLVDVIDMATSKFAEKYPEEKIYINIENKEEILLADASNLSEVIYNLLTNAYEATLLKEDVEPKVEIIVREERLYTVIEVKDNGVGIPNSKNIKIFEPFFTTKNTNSNWGMGLYYVRKIVKGHVGRLKVESEKGEGTSFFIMLPKYEYKKRSHKNAEN